MVSARAHIDTDPRDFWHTVVLIFMGSDPMGQTPQRGLNLDGTRPEPTPGDVAGIETRKGHGRSGRADERPERLLEPVGGALEGSCDDEADRRAAGAGEIQPRVERFPDERERQELLREAGEEERADVAATREHGFRSRSIAAADEQALL